MTCPRLAVLASLCLPWLIGCAGTSGPSPDNVEARQGASKSRELFNGQNLTGFRVMLNDPDALADDVFMVRDGVLICTGSVQGWLETLQAYTNYELTVEWRWPNEPGNSGVLLHVGGLDQTLGWPKSIEAQLASGQAGDLWEIGQSIQVPDASTRRRPEQPGDLHSHRRIQRLVGVTERPAGEWNTMVVRCDRDRITVTVNGTLANEGTDCSAVRGHIGLQSEGAPVEFRRVHLAPLSF